MPALLCEDVMPAWRRPLALELAPVPVGEGLWPRPSRPARAPLPPQGSLTAPYSSSATPDTSPRWHAQRAAGPSALFNPPSAHGIGDGGWASSPERAQPSSVFQSATDAEGTSYAQVGFGSRRPPLLVLLG